jgi:3'-phosphoadenosine 5'-phosphosulfate sulfotransferase (PAPS reductase)/FAD synthetase
MNALLRHECIAFQFSGGKDSVAALFLLRDYWTRFTVYFCDSGDCPEETQAVVRYVAALVPRFFRITGRVREIKSAYGLPTDVLPWSSAPAAHHHNAGETPLMQDRVACCSRSIMAPLHERMVQDGITLIIRGQKDADVHKGQFRSGDIADGFEFLYPVEHWTDDMCATAMLASGVPVPRYYSAGLHHSGDCATCTAWCESGKADYLAKHYPLKFVEYRANMAIIEAAVSPALSNFHKELEACHGLAI